MDVSFGAAVIIIIYYYKSKDYNCSVTESVRCKFQEICFESNLALWFFDVSMFYHFLAFCNLNF